MGDAASDSAQPEPIVNFNRACSSVAAERNTAPIVAEVTRLLGADVRGRVRSGSQRALTGALTGLPYRRRWRWLPARASTALRWPLRCRV